MLSISEERAAAERECSELKAELTALRARLAEVERERDSLWKCDRHHHDLWLRVDGILDATTFKSRMNQLEAIREAIHDPSLESPVDDLLDSILTECDRLDQENTRLRKAVDSAVDDVCSLHCPSTWNTGERPPHSEKCQAITAALHPPASEEVKHDAK